MFEMDKSEQGTEVAKAVRAIQESMISNHFGERILDSLFENYARLVDEEMAKDIKPVTFVLVLSKIWMYRLIYVSPQIPRGYFSSQ